MSEKARMLLRFLLRTHEINCVQSWGFIIFVRGKREIEKETLGGQSLESLGLGTS
jgi:hypothetical protein